MPSKKYAKVKSYVKRANVDELRKLARRMGVKDAAGMTRPELEKELLTPKTLAYLHDILISAAVLIPSLAAQGALIGTATMKNENGTKKFGLHPGVGAGVGAALGLLTSTTVVPIKRAIVDAMTKRRYVVDVPPEAIRSKVNRTVRTAIDKKLRPPPARKLSPDLRETKYAKKRLLRDVLTPGTGLGRK
jgi:hypothetical protein